MRSSRIVLNGISLMAVGVIAFAAGVSVGQEKRADPKVYELRTYTTLPGRLPALHRRFAGVWTVKIFKMLLLGILAVFLLLSTLAIMEVQAQANSAQVTELQQKLDRLKRDLADMHPVLRENYPSVIQLKSMIDELEREIAARKNTDSAVNLAPPARP